MPAEIGLVGEDVGGEGDRWREGRKIGAGGFDARTKIVPEIFPLHRPMVSASKLKLNAAARSPAGE